MERQALHGACFMAVCLLVLSSSVQSRHLLQPKLTPFDTTKACPTNNCRKEGAQNYCLSSFSRTCQSSVNWNCAACDNFRKLAACHDKGTNPACTGDTNINDPFSGSSSPHYLAQPLTPCTGIEAIMKGDAKGTEGLWQDAWTTATKTAGLKANEVGIIMNSFAYRAQHQMHAHIGKMDGAFKKCLQNKPYPTFKTWVARECTLQGSVPNTFQMYSITTNNLANINDLIATGASSVPWNTSPKVAAGVIVTYVPGHSTDFTVTLFNSEPKGGMGHFNVGDHLIMEYQ